MIGKTAWIGTYAIGTLVAFAVGLPTLYESSYNKWITSADRTYRLTATITPPNGGMIRNATSPRPLHGLIKHDFPHIVEASAYYTFALRRVRRQGDEHYVELPWLNVSPNFFDVFPLGSAPLNGRDDVALDSDVSESLLGGLSAGSIIDVEGMGVAKVREIVAPFPHNSTVKGSAFAGLDVMESPESPEHWFQFSGFTYVRLKSPELIDDLLAAVAQATDRWIELGPSGPKPSSIIRFEAQRVDDVRFAEGLAGEVVAPGDARLVKAGHIALGFLVVIVLFNGVSIAEAASRARRLEAGLEWLFGVSVLRVLGRCAAWVGTLCVIGILISALLLVAIRLPWLHDAILPVVAKDFGAVLLIVFAMISVHIASATWYSLRAGHAFRHGAEWSPSWSRGLVGVFAEAVLAAGIGLVAATAMTDFLRLATEDLGFDNKDIFVVKTTRGTDAQELIALKRALVEETDVSDAAVASTYPLSNATAIGQTYWIDPDNAIPVHLIAADGDFGRTLGLRLTQGRFLDSERTADVVIDDRGSVVITEGLAQVLGRLVGSRNGVLGQEVVVQTGIAALRLEVVGTVADFRVGVGKSSRPAVIYDDPRERSLVLFRANREDIDLEQFGQRASQTADGILGEERWDGVNVAQVWGSVLEEAGNRAYLLAGGTLVASLLLWAGLLAVLNIYVGGNMEELGLRVTFGASNWSALVSVTGLISTSFLAAIVVGLVAGHFCLLQVAGLDSSGVGSYVATACAGLAVLLCSLAVILPRLRGKSPAVVLSNNDTRYRW